MKVYIITKGEYSDYHICSVCLDKETAEKRKDLYSDGWDKAEIETYDTDDSCDEYYKVGDEIYRKDGKIQYCVTVFDNGETVVKKRDYIVDDINTLCLENSCNKFNNSVNLKCIAKGVTHISTIGTRGYAAIVFAKNEEEAKKITYDLIAKKKWEDVETEE